MGDFMPIGMPFDDERNCTYIAQTDDVLTWLKTTKSLWKVEIGKSTIGGDFKLPPMSVPKGRPTVPKGRPTMRR